MGVPFASDLNLEPAWLALAKQDTKWQDTIDTNRLDTPRPIGLSYAHDVHLGLHWHGTARHGRAKHDKAQYGAEWCNIARTGQTVAQVNASVAYLQIMLSSAVDHILNCCFHCSTDTPELHNTSARLRTVQHAVTPTRLLPAPANQCTLKAH